MEVHSMFPDVSLIIDRNKYVYRTIVILFYMLQKQ